MSAREAEELREVYTQALIGMFGFMDSGIKFTTGGHQEPDIWATIDDGDIKIIVDTRLSAAQHSARAAAGVRRTINWYQQVAIYMILGPRIWMTLEYYSKQGFDLPINFRRPRRKMRVVHPGESA